MACKCTQTTSNATGGGAITSPLSACSYTLWVNQISGCTGSALDVHFGNPGANILFNLGINDNGYPDEAYGTNNFSIDNPNPLHRFSIGNQGNIDVEEYIHFGDGTLTGNTGNNKTGTVGDLYLGYKAGYTRTTNYNSSFNTVVGTSSLGSTGVLDTSFNNVTIGAVTMQNATSARNNVIVGTNAGNALTIGSSNVYLGYGQGVLETTKSNELRIGNETQTAGGSKRPLIQGDFATSATTLWGSARITNLPRDAHDSFVTIGNGTVNGGYLTASNYGLDNTGVWTANTQDCSTSNGCDCSQPGCDCGYYEGTGANGYRSVSISGGTNHTATDSDWAGTRVGIGTQFPEVPLHIKAPFGYMKVQSTVGGSYIESLTPNANAYIGVAAGNGVKSGSTTWRMHASNTPFSIRDWKVGANQQVGTGFTLQHRTQGNGVQTVTNPITVAGDYMSDPTKGLDGALVIRSGDGSGGSGGIGGNQNPSHGIGIFTTRPTKELTVIGAMSATGSIHSTDYIKFPNPTRSVYIGFDSDSGNTTNTQNTSLGYGAFGGGAGLVDGAADNTAIGYGTLNSIGTGISNTAVGSESQTELTTGSRNTSVGSGALLQMVTGSDNVAIGDGAMDESHGDRSTAVGSSSLNGEMDGIQNTGLGYKTLFTNATGRDNVALGHGAMIGEGNPHSYNTAAGAGSLSGITTGGCNVTVGNNAGAGITVIGGKITTGSNNIAIGCEVDVKDGTLDNQINIGNIIYGKDNFIGIKNDTPLKTVDVIGEIQLTGDLFPNGNIIGDGATSISGINTVTASGDITSGDKFIMSNVATNYMIGNGGGGGNDVEIHSANDIELKCADDITLEATGRVEMTEFGAAEPSISFDLNDVPGQAFIENYSGNEVAGVIASTRRLYLCWQGGIPAAQQTWISGNENNGGEIDLTLGSSNDIIFSATNVGMGTTLPKTKLDVHHDPTGLAVNTGGGEVVTFGSAGADYAAGFLVQLRGASNWVKADADDTTQQGSLLGIALGAAPSNGILLKGFYKINTADDVTTWTNGGQLYVSVTDGKITESTGSMGSGDYVRVVGYMTTTTNVMYFNPESTYVVIT